MSTSSEDIARLFRVRKTALKMLVDRGFIVVKEELDQTLDSFKNQYGTDSKMRDNLTITVPRVNDPNSKMMVFFGNSQKLGVEELRGFGGRMEANSAKHAVIIYPGNPTSRLLDVINKTNSDGKLNYQIFSEKELLVNITEHILVPQHIPLTPEQVKELLKRYKLKSSQLPRIQVSDPIARYYGLARGQVVKIIRQSETAGKYVTYRTVT